PELEREELVRETERLQNALGALERRRAAESQASNEIVRQYEAGQRHLPALVDARDRELEAIRRTKIFRYTTTLRRIYGWLRRPSAPSQTANDPARPPDGTYELWIERYDTLDDATRASLGELVARLAYQP